MMHRIFDRIDNTMIDYVFQPLVDWIAHHFSIDCFVQARVCTGISAVAWILSQARDLVLAVQSGVVGLQVFQAALLLLGLGAIMVLHTLFQRAGGGGKGPGRANPLRVAMYGHRFTILIGLLVSVLKLAIGVGSFVLLAMILFATAAVYIGACSHPPAKRQTQQGVDWRRRTAASPLLAGRVSVRD